MTALEVLVEEPSAQEAMRFLLPNMIGDRAAFKVINMRNKSRLLRDLPARLRAYRKRIDQGEALRIIVLVDRDQDDCEQLKRDLERCQPDCYRRAGILVHRRHGGLTTGLSKLAKPVPRQFQAA